jgi:hypothetical protein
MQRGELACKQDFHIKPTSLDVAIPALARIRPAQGSDLRLVITI